MYIFGTVLELSMFEDQDLEKYSLSFAQDKVLF